MTELGRLTPVDDLREAWPKEDADFTPWLAERNIDLLSEALGIDLELHSTEVNVGGFRADIVATNTADGTKVVIENQLEDSDHEHIGKAITYAAGLSASTIVWIAKRFSDEHRAALDWLNKATNVNTRFVGIEVKLWKIGCSKTAPQFVIVSQPNDWTQVDGDVPLTDMQQENIDFWKGVADVLVDTASSVKPMRPQPQTFAFYAIGRAKFQLRASFSRQKGQLAVALLIQGEHAQAFGGLLEEHKQAIHEELGFKIEWKQPHGQQKSTVLTSFNQEADPVNRDQWPVQHDWISKRLGDFNRVFRDRIRRLDPGDFDPLAASEA